MPRIRLIGENGEPLGFLNTYEAIRMAADKGMDLVEVARDVDPPVCRLMDFGKQKYRQKKRLHDAKKHHHAVEIKEIWFRPGIDPHDREIKLTSARRFLDEGFRVALTMRFRGREKQHKGHGLRVLDELGNALKELGRVEQGAKNADNKIQIVVAPLKRKKAPSVKPATPPKEDQKEEAASHDENP